MLEAYLVSKPKNGTECSEGLPYSQECGCLQNNNTLPTPTTPDQATSETCTLCRDGSEPLNLEKDLSEKLLKLFGTSGTCQSLADSLKIATKGNSETCRAAQTNFGGLCGCPPVENYCVLCPNDKRIPEPDTVIEHIERDYGLTVTCQNFTEYLNQIPADDRLCWESQQYAFLCGCNNGIRGVMGANTRIKERVLVWIPRLTGFGPKVNQVALVADQFLHPFCVRGTPESILTQNVVFVSVEQRKTQRVFLIDGTAATKIFPRKFRQLPRILRICWSIRAIEGNGQGEGRQPLFAWA